MAMSRYEASRASDDRSHRSRRPPLPRSRYRSPSEDSYFDDDRRSYRSSRTQRTQRSQGSKRNHGRQNQRQGRNANNDSGRGATDGPGGSKYDMLGKASLFIGFLEITVGLLQLWTTKKSADRDQQNQRQQQQEFEERKRQRRRDEARRDREEQRKWDAYYADEDGPSQVRSIGYHDGYEDGASRTSKAKGRIEAPPSRARSRARSEGGRSHGGRSVREENEEEDSGYGTPSRYDREAPSRYERRYEDDRRSRRG
ncbi:hypothetical protein KC367_g5512 [Hortaea werneckii]|uniref:Uncharacterized protein n=1 Tax=Hortaea werneckii TaxID=91943 RepID=A0A3M7IYE7_HORWE|nr:hypothetical protein KC358_g12852 [Hortaea werneckii]KAI6810515.1 hypothetical protein KC350_g12502 [Hortaea werneckii]KAI6929825.1 hypothetical protein KC348_g7730 [Hortaea werneckii]KAI6935119.1 hypothetical protein KC341_g7137 [Hortaea werneckii]KAI6969849.1 hypothetical protein KC321_g7644 [Hortaea werneckii]